MYTLNSYDRQTGKFNMESPGFTLEDAIEARDSGNGNFVVASVLRFEVVNEDTREVLA